jgi:UDPglucose--hexose-1-phosphate uridylyltransferase
MSELRKDPVLGRWIIIAEERAKRPSDFRSDTTEVKGGVCPFCEGSEHMTPPEILAFRSRDSQPNHRGWWVRVVPNKFPALAIEGGLGKRGVGIYDKMRGIGAHEVIIETNEHHLSLTEIEDAGIKDVVWAYRDRLVDLRRDNRFVYGLVFKNVGIAAGASLEHTHSQLIATPTIPSTPQREMNGCSEFFKFRGRCLYCDMITQEIEQGERLVMETSEFVAFTPFASRFPFETWILPKEHNSHFEDVDNGEVEGLSFILKAVLTRLEDVLDKPPYNYMIHTSPFDLGFLDYYHWHIEIIPRLTKVAGFEWGSGFYINPVSPEVAAKHLRGEKFEE